MEKTYIANGMRFNSYNDVVEYADKHGLRIGIVEKFCNGVILITLNSAA